MSDLVCRKALAVGLEAIKAEFLVKQKLPIIWHQSIQHLGSVGLQIGEDHCVLDGNLYVAAFGKASAGMCRAVQTTPSLHSHLVRGVVSMPSGCRHSFIANGLENQLPLSDSRWELYEGAANNIPDENAVKAARRIASMATDLTETDVLLVLISGGGSALLPLPVDSVTLTEKQTTVKVMSRAGATIQQLNTVRQHLSQLKNGGLARLAAPAKVLSLIISDVISDELQFIASGPTCPSQTTPQDALSVIEQLHLTADIPVSVLQHLRTAPAPNLSTPPNSVTTTRVQNLIIGNNRTALTAMAEHFTVAGYPTTVLDRMPLSGEAAAFGRSLAELLDTANDHPIPSPLPDFPRSCLLWGGETTVTVGAHGGKGGRNQELALAFLIEAGRLRLAEWDVDFALMAVGTDGQDGPTDAAGALVRREDVRRLKADKAALAEAERALAEHDSYNFFARWADGDCHLKPGLTGTNVMDVVAFVVDFR